MGLGEPASVPEVDPYARIADLYDLEHGAFTADLEFYLNVAQAVGDPILELGCGSGRVLLPLAEEGFRVTGLDASPAMLDRARAAIDAAGVAERLTLVHSDMAEADRAPGGPFGLALIPLNGLVHAATPAAQRAVLESARRALDPRGQLVIDVFNPTPDALRAFDQSAVHEGRWRLPNGTVVDKFGARTLHAATQTIATDLWYDLTDAGGALHRIATSYTMRYLYMAELALMLELAGFVEWEVYGGYDLEPYEDNSERLLVTAEVTRSR